ncbi:hypothetical protein NQ318_017554 [Aromia moschata]|uniref:Nucleolar protein 9 n=1 Tax=Aromia moschata TaxID=1265417 RepID=A0AAV8Z3J2_9CUCU|nr:hypothetical protein NQ318_017554 [Aromia moschata]
MSDEPTNKRNTRKRKKSFLKNARKYGKKGYYGRGSELDADTYQYFIRIMETYREGFANDEERSIFADNVFEQTVSKEVECSCNQVGCRVVETLLPFSNDDTLRKFMEAFSSDLRRLCGDRFASHVLEALVVQACTRSFTSSDESKSYFKEFSAKISKFLLNNLEDYVWDTYGNHIVRTCLENLVQLPKEGNKNEGRVKVEENQDIPEEYVGIVKEYGERIIVWPQFNELCSSELTSCLLQVLLKCLKKTDKKLLKKYLKKLLDEIFAPNAEENTGAGTSLSPAFLSKPVLMLLETTVQIAPPKTFTQIYAKCFKGNLPKLSKTRNTNFAVQKLIQYCTEKVEFEAMFDELSDHFAEIIEAGHTGVILALAQTCKRLCAKQGSFVQNLMKSLNCSEPEERQTNFIVSLSRFCKYGPDQPSNENLQKEKLNLHGTLILQALLDFNKPIKIVNGILGMEQTQLKDLFCNTMGSHIVDSYVKGAFVGEKSREKLVRKMMGAYREMASLKYGSRSFEAIWNAAALKAKLQIMDELCYKDGAWSNSECGKIIAAKVNLALYKRNKEEWKNSLNKVDKSALFADILK